MNPEPRLPLFLHYLLAWTNQGLIGLIVVVFMAVYAFFVNRLGWPVFPALAAMVYWFLCFLYQWWITTDKEEE